MDSLHLFLLYSLLFDLLLLYLTNVSLAISVSNILTVYTRTQCQIIMMLQGSLHESRGRKVLLINFVMRAIIIRRLFFESSHFSSHYYSWKLTLLS